MVLELLLHARQGPPPMPPGADPNSPESRVALLYGFMGAFVPVAFVILSLRLYSRWRFTTIGKDDVLVLIAFILYIGLTIATIMAAKFGLGKHIWTISEQAGIQMQKARPGGTPGLFRFFANAVQCGFTSQVLYPPALMAVKLSIVFFFIRVLPPVHESKPWLYGFAAFIFAEEAAFTIGLFLQCQPINFYWDKSVEGGVCFNQQAFYYVDAAFNMATDLVLLALPWALFWKLNVSKRQKYTVVAICSLGVFTLISSILRFPYLHGLNQSSDPTWDVPNIVIWTIAELGSAISLSSIPAIRPLYAHLFLKKRSPGNSSDNSGPGTKQPRRTAKSNLPFSIGTFGSVADKSTWKNQVQMFSLKSDREQSQIRTMASESQDHIVEQGKLNEVMTSRSYSVEILGGKEAAPEPKRH
ncbi:hypothetical protein OQA88_2961 [Cercophora sp. LCS_1]